MAIKSSSFSLLDNVVYSRGQTVFLLSFFGSIVNAFLLLLLSSNPTPVDPRVV
ncbi:hypothetical protein HanXRQr2_Chr11g0507651 [Helianthus annuus]|uniref:Uncharacterized protein n=1 Tax=Helianthus annuus TaxID=4232 RepID=A0A9K3HSD4_HELAN|nr:hypothetical protein HanXRQr2_Chr11g0507651 [Helianthus annuus]